MDDFPVEGHPVCPGCGREYDSSGKCPCGYDEEVRRWENRPGRAKRAALASRDWPDEAGEREPCEDSEAETLPAIRPEDLNGFHQQLRRELKYELPRWHPPAQAPTLKRRLPKDKRNTEEAQKAMSKAERWREAWEHREDLEEAERKAMDEVVRLREALGHPEDLLKRLLGPLVWLGARILEREAPRDRPRVAQEFAHYVLSPTATGDTFLEHELKRLNPGDFPQGLHNDLKQLLPLYRFLYRGGQKEIEQRLIKLLKTEIRRMFLRSPALSRSPVARRVRAALLSDEPSKEIRKLLNEAGWNESEWAAAATFHRSTISHLIAGEQLRASTFNRLIEVLEKQLAPKQVNH